jgi:acyl-CoA thioester hydrolase
VTDDRTQGNAAPAPAPLLTDFPARTFDKLRYGDTDRQGHINNAVFTTFLETGRVEVLLGTGAAGLLPSGSAFVIVKLSVEFRAEVHWPGRVDIGTRVKALGRSSVTFEQALFQDGKLVGTAETVIVQMSEATRRSEPLAPEVAAHLKGFMA